MPKFRYSLNSGVNWVVVDAALPFNIPSTAAQDVIVEPIGAAVSNLGTVNGNFLSLNYDAANPSADVVAFTNTAGTLYWCFTNSMTPPTGAQIIAGTGFISAGNVATVPGGLAITLPSRSGASDVFMHAIVDGVNDTNIATVRVYIGTSSAFATISSVTGSPTITNYTDGEGTWRAWEFTTGGSFTVGAGGGIEYELVAGGGPGGGGAAFTYHGGGGAGGVLRGTTTLTPGTYNIVVGAGGAPGNNGGDSTAIGLTAVGGGQGGVGTAGALATAGGSGGGGRSTTVSPGGAGTSGQGFAGGIGAQQGGGGGGGASSVGGNAATQVGGNGGAGITTAITGTARNIAGGGAGNGGTGSVSVPGTASFGGGAAAITNSSTNTNGGNGTSPGAGGGAASGSGTGGSGFRGHFVLRVKTA